MLCGCYCCYSFGGFFSQLKSKFESINRAGILGFKILERDFFLGRKGPFSKNIEDYSDAQFHAV